MISFLNSGILFLASAIVIPVLIYLFAKKRPKKIVFSSIKFIKQTQQQQKKRINIKNLLLLLIRILIILLIVLAISRPAMQSKQLFRNSDHPKTALAIIIDNSYSMNYLIDTQTELDKAKQIAIQINEVLNNDDIVIFLTADDNWNALHGNTTYGKIDPDLIHNIKLTSKSLSLRELLITAEKKLKDVHIPNREIIMISDLQASEMPEEITIPTFLIPTSQNEEKFNISCENSRLENQIVKQGLRKKISFELTNHSSLIQQDVIYRLFLDGNTISEKVTDLQPQQRKVESFEIEVENEGWHTGYVEVKNERLTFDNRNYFSFFHDASLRIAVLTDLDRLPLSLDSFLEIYRGENGEIDLLSTDNLSRSLLETYDNLIVYERTFSPRIEFILDDLIDKDFGVLFICDDQLSEEWQKYLAEKFDLNFMEFAHYKSASVISFVNNFHSISRDIKIGNTISINDFWKVTNSSSALLKSNEFPLALANKRMCLWLFDVASIQNPFLLDNAFPVFAYNSLRFTTRFDLMSSEKKVGDRLQAFEITLPNSKMVQPGNKKFQTTIPGIYLIDDKPIPVNLDYIESKYSRLSETKVKNIEILESDWQYKILHSRYGYEIWKYLLIAVLILFAAEMFIVKREENK